ncbi:MAG: hypothetical protein JRH01_26115, partial [Deltaproteobacteria bacterium]|nr:hypothetical protein [Deltaproteobacteria bacterium]
MALAVSSRAQQLDAEKLLNCGAPSCLIAQPQAFTEGNAALLAARRIRGNGSGCDGMDEAVQVISELIWSREKGRVAGLQGCDDLDASSCRHLALAVQRDRLIVRAFDIGSWDL